MKPTKRLTTIALLSIFLITSAITFAKKKPRISNVINNQGITHLVTIESQVPQEPCHAYYVVLRDENGEQIEGALLFHEGIMNYVFHESGPVTGTRTVSLEMGYGHGNGQYSCSVILQASPRSISGDFRNGQTYLFPLQIQVAVGFD